MSTPAPQRMSAAAFLAWAPQQDARFELVAGEVVAMAPERAAHARVKARAWLALRDAINAAELPCEAFTDGMAVLIDDRTVYEPDALVRCGDTLDGDATAVTDPIVVVEVLSPSTRARDAGAKLEDYFRLPSVSHYLILKTESGTVIHHERRADGEIHTHILRDGAVSMTPPGLSVAVGDLFGG